MKLQMVNSMENITWSELGKQTYKLKFMSTRQESFLLLLPIWCLKKEIVSYILLLNSPYIMVSCQFLPPICF